MTVTLVHLVENTLGESDVTTTTVIDGAIFEPGSQAPQNIDQAQATYAQGVFNLPGVYVADAGDTLQADGTWWQVLGPASVWLDRTRVLVAASTFPDVVSLRVPGGSGTAWNDTTHRTEVTPFAPFASGVAARIQPIGGAAGNEPAVADDQVTVAGYRVSLPLTADGVDELVVDGEQNTLIDVTDSPDPLLIGKTLRVTDLVRGSHRFERVLFCTLND